MKMSAAAFGGNMKLLLDIWGFGRCPPDVCENAHLWEPWGNVVVVVVIKPLKWWTDILDLVFVKALAGIRRINLEGLRWKVFDAKGQVLGRLASQVSTVLQGKDKPTYTPNRDDGDMCIVLNAKDICVTGRKLTDKHYRWHTGYVGHLKERTLKDQMAKDPTEVIRKAVLRMLPRNKLRDDRDRKLRIFTGDEHPFGDKPLDPYVMPPRQVREMRPRARRAMIRAQKKVELQKQGGAAIPIRKNKKKDEENVEVLA
ncbi:hypothetical protein KSS87_013998 [Heliosperma pusillum]|nr:hypothetical protein KSS87_013998 [Heliosperma pusillum]